MAVGRYCITVMYRLYSCLSCISDWHADYDRGSWKRLCSWTDRSSSICSDIGGIDSEKRKNVQCRIPSARIKQRKGWQSMANFLVIGIILLIVGIAVTYIWKAKKSGAKCIGCPSAGGCYGKDGNTGCNCKCHSAENK